MADKASVSTFEMITQAIEAAKEEFKKSIKPVAPSGPNIDIEIKSKTALLNYARTMKAYYHFLAEDAPSTARLDMNISEKVKEITTNTTKSFDDLDKAYATLAPSLAKNISVATEIHTSFKNLTSFLKGLSVDINQVDDPLLKTAIGKALAEVNAKEKKVLNDEEETKEQEKLLKTLVEETGLDAVKLVGDSAKSVEEFVNNLKDEAFLTPLFGMNFPALKMNFQNFSSAHANLSKDISTQLATYVKAKDSALAELLKAKSGSSTAAVEVNDLIEKLLGKDKQIHIVLTSKLSVKDNAVIAAAEAAKKEVADKTAELDRQKADFVSQSTIKQTLEAYLLAKDNTTNLNAAYKLSLKNLDNTFKKIVDEQRFKTLAEGLNKNVKGIIDVVKNLGEVSGIISSMNQKLSSKDAISDVREYLNQSSKTLEGLIEPVKNLSAITLSNIASLNQLDLDVSNLYNANYKGLNDLYEASALNNEETAKSFAAKINVGLVEKLAKNLVEIKNAIGVITTDLDLLTQKSLEIENEAEFRKSIAAAA